MRFDWETCNHLTPILLVAAAVGIVAGVRAGFRGSGLSEAVRTAVIGQGLMMFAGTAILAALISLPEAGRTSRTYFTHEPDPGCTCLECNPDLLISQPSPPLRDSSGRNMLIIRSPRYFVVDALRRGAEWGFLAPVFALIGAIPAASVAFIAYPFGTRKRLATQGSPRPVPLTLEPPDPPA